MAAVDQHLIRRPDGLVLLLTPPLDHTSHDPGYIKGYVPGIRENGGQYTHAAVWALIAFAAMGDGDKASELFRMLNPINHSNSRAGAQRVQNSSRMSSQAMFTQKLRTWGAVGGRGIQAQQAGFIALVSNGFWDSACAA